MFNNTSLKFWVFKVVFYTVEKNRRILLIQLNYKFPEKNNKKKRRKDRKI